VRRPAWFEPLDSAGEWIGFLGGVATVAALAWLVLGGAWSPRDAIPNRACLRMSETCMASAYRVRNDTAGAVVLRECARRCGPRDARYPKRVVVAAGQETPATVDAVIGWVPFFGVHVRDWWEVRTSAGRLLGCLVLAGRPHGQGGERLVVAVSARGPCGRAVAPTPPLAA
jgi:hypothetical protein